MPGPLITLTTDFGTDSPYAAAMKGVILGLNPAARIVDLTHDLPPQDILHAAFFLAEAIPFFSPGVVHVAVVDPGVGAKRKLLYVEVAGHRLLAPDNGLWTLLARNRSIDRVLQLTEPRFWRQAVSPTFHGRDVLAPVAAHLSLGLDPTQLGPPTQTWVELSVGTPVQEGERIRGQVLFVDHFGNLLTDIPAAILPAGGPAKIMIEGNRIDCWVRTYGEAEAGDLVGLIGSSGWLEIALVRGNAAEWLGVGTGVLVDVWLRELLAGP